tara:strand:- start:1800 stop:1997 length:198 start_codon:yes stop_codon:yes gene_type:complete
MHKQPTDQQPPHAGDDQASQKEEGFAHKKSAEVGSECFFLYSFLEIMARMLARYWMLDAGSADFV